MQRRTKDNDDAGTLHSRVSQQYFHRSRFGAFFYEQLKLLSIHHIFCPMHLSKKKKKHVFLKKTCLNQDRSKSVLLLTHLLSCTSYSNFLSFVFLTGQVAIIILTSLG